MFSLLVENVHTNVLTALTFVHLQSTNLLRVGVIH